MKLIQETYLDREQVAKNLHRLALKAAIGEMANTANKYIQVKGSREECNKVEVSAVHHCMSAAA